MEKSEADPDENAENWKISMISIIWYKLLFKLRHCKHTAVHTHTHTNTRKITEFSISPQLNFFYIFHSNTNFHELLGKSRHINIYIRHHHTTQFLINSFCLEFSHNFPHFTGKNVKRNCSKKSQPKHSIQVRTNRIRRVGGKPRNTEIIL